MFLKVKLDSSANCPRYYLENDTTGERLSALFYNKEIAEKVVKELAMQAGYGDNPLDIDGIWPYTDINIPTTHDWLHAQIEWVSIPGGGAPNPLPGHSIQKWPPGFIPMADL